MTFTTNRWVRGDAFFGRTALLNELKGRRGRATWILGNRRVGKTSLLRQIEWSCDNEKWENTLALYWDFQGSGSSEGLKESFLECLEDKPSLLKKLDIETDQWDDLTFPEITLRFRRRMKRIRPKRILLLVDEVEELVDVCKAEPHVLGALRKLQDATGFLTIFVAGSLRLLDLDESRARTSPFLPDFLPPVLLGPLDSDAAGSLLGRGGIKGGDASEIHHLCFGNPHLIQCFAERFLRFQDNDEVMQDLRAQKVLDYYFQSVFHCLPAEFREYWDQKQCLKCLEKVGREDPNFPYLVQASLVRDGDHGIEVNPLLAFLEGRPSTSIQSGEPENEKISRNADHPPYKELIHALEARSFQLTVLPQGVFQDDFSSLAGFGNPPGLNILYSAGEASQELLRILDGASPEYVLGVDADFRTGVYLVGLFLFQWLFGRAPFDDDTDPWSRAEKLSEKDPPLESTSCHGHEVDSRVSMVLLRAMSPRPQDRYQDMDTLQSDLDAVFGD